MAVVAGIAIGALNRKLGLSKKLSIKSVAFGHKSVVRDETGSISVLTIGLFLLTIALLALITDIGSIAVAKRSLVHINESAAIRAAHTLNERSYYEAGARPGVPIDCSAAQREIRDEIDSWLQSSVDMRRPELESIRVTNFNCSGSLVELSLSATARLPFRLPGSSISTVELGSTVASESARNG